MFKWNIVLVALSVCKLSRESMYCCYDVEVGSNYAYYA